MVMGMHPHFGMTPSKEVGPSNLSLISVGSAYKVKEFVGGMYGEVVVDGGAGDPGVDSMEDASSHESSDFLSIQESAKSCETACDDKTTVRTSENMIPVFVEAATTGASVIMTFISSTEFFVGSPEFEH